MDGVCVEGGAGFGCAYVGFISKREGRGQKGVRKEREVVVLTASPLGPIIPG